MLYSFGNSWLCKKRCNIAINIPGRNREQAQLLNVGSETNRLLINSKRLELNLSRYTLFMCDVFGAIQYIILFFFTFKGKKFSRIPWNKNPAKISSLNRFKVNYFHFTFYDIVILLFLLTLRSVFQLIFYFNAWKYIC